MDYFPIGKNFSREELTREFDLVRETPYENQELAYKILMPKTWKGEFIRAETKYLNPNTLKPLGIYKGPEQGGANPYVQIQAAQLVREITAANWLRHYAIVNDRNIIAIKPISTHFADSVMNFLIEGHKFTARSTASIDGDRVFFLLNFALESVYEKYADIFGVCVVSFNIQNPSSKQSVENHVLYDLKQIVRFRYPESWKYKEVTEAPQGKAGVDLFNYDPDGNVCGKIRVKTVDKNVSQGVETQVKDTLDEYVEANVRSSRIIENANVEIGSYRFTSAMVTAYKGAIEGSEIEQEIWVCVIEDPEYFIVVSMLTPFRERLFYMWALNRRAFDIVLETLA